MNLSEIFTSGGGLLLLALTLVQISPIKINPWSWIGKKIRNQIYGPVEEKLDKLDKKMDEREAASARYRILRFNDEILQQKKHTKEHFDQILDDINTYETYCREHPDYPNNKAVLAIENIEGVYKQCSSEHSFL